ncbi:hypothetical protein R6Q59_009741 [Mikania micrantha]
MLIPLVEKPVAPLTPQRGRRWMPVEALKRSRCSMMNDPLKAFHKYAKLRNVSWYNKSIADRSSRMLESTAGRCKSKARS